MWAKPSSVRSYRISRWTATFARFWAKDHVNIFIYDPIAPDPEGIINQGKDNTTARAIQVYEGEPIKKRALLNLFKAVIANNRAGGWRRLLRK